MIKVAAKKVDSIFFKKKLSFFYKNSKYAAKYSFSARRSIFEKQIKHAWKEKNLTEVESKILEFSNTQSLSTWVINFYIKNFLFNGNFKILDNLKRSKYLRNDHLLLIESAHFRAVGDLQQSLEKLNFHSNSEVVRFHRANYERAMLHRLRNDEEKLKKGIDFIQAEENLILLDFAWHTAGSAQNCNEPAAEKIAIQRIFRDLEKVKNSRLLLKKYWRQAINTQIKIFDLKGALQTARLAKEFKILKTNVEEDKIIGLLQRTYSIRDMVDNGFEKVLESGGLFSRIFKSPRPVIVLHSACVSSNFIDYEGFREDIVSIYRNSLDFFQHKGVSYDVDVKFLTHGTIHHDRPYISYHTYSCGSLGIHFKETDRVSQFSFDPNGYAGWSSFSSLSLENDLFKSVDQNSASNFFSRDQALFKNKRTSKYKQKENHLAFDKKYIFVALQIMGDAVQQLAFCSPFEMLNGVMEVAARENLNVVVKKHPYCKSPEIESFLAKAESKGYLSVVDANIHDLIKDASAVCVINSGVGAEALIYRKPVYVFGKSDYMGGCFVCHSKEDFINTFEVGKAPLSDNELDIFWYVYRNFYSINLLQKKQAEEKIFNLLEDHFFRINKTFAR